jgi:hypothetical protein
LRSKPSARKENAAGPRAEIDEKTERPLPERFVHGRFDLAFGDVERANVVPFACMRLEICLRCFGTRLLHGCRTRVVAGKGEVTLIEARHDSGRKCGFGTAVGKAEEHPRAFAEAPDEPGLGHQLQMPTDAWLALSQNLGQVLHV